MGLGCNVFDEIFEKYDVSHEIAYFRLITLGHLHDKTENSFKYIF